MTKEVLKKAFDWLDRDVPKENYNLNYSVEVWKLMSDKKMYSMTHEDIANAKDGFIGHFNGVDCYITPTFNASSKP